MHMLMFDYKFIENLKGACVFANNNQGNLIIE